MIKIEYTLEAENTNKVFKYSDIVASPASPAMDRTPILIFHKYGNVDRYKDFVYYTPKQLFHSVNPGGKREKNITP